MLRLFILLATSAALVCACAAQVRTGARASAERVLLRRGWSIQSSARASETGAVLSDPRHKVEGWYPAEVPSTVVAALVADGALPDPFYGMNLRTYPGCSYPVGKNFSNLEMPADSPYRVSWWYRTEFHAPAAESGRRVWLHFDGINFRANIWLNGRQLATSDEVAGTFRRYEFDVTEAVRGDGPNALAVEVFASSPGDLAYTWVDWNPAPPDKNLGLWQDVYLTTSGPVALRYPQVTTRLDAATHTSAGLTVSAELTNATARAVAGELRGRIEGLSFAQEVRLAPRETRTVIFTPEQFRQLNLARPRLWWPVHMGAQELYPLELEFVADGRISDQQTTHFGIREVTSELDRDGHRVFRVNGRRVLIRGGGWAPDMLLRYSPERMRAELEYVRDMNLNAVRQEGKLEPDEFYDLADRLGILVIAGWCCCDHWEHWQHRDDYKEGPVWEQEDYRVAELSLIDQVRRLRNHPSLLVWMNGSDNPPPPDVERMYISVLEKYRWPNPYVSSATARKTEVTGASGVKMEGPYEWVPPNYWLLDREHGGAHGFATEISPGPAVPPVESLRRMLPKEHLWPIDEVWNYHAGGGQFKTLDVFTRALTARYGAAGGVEEYARKAQAMAYEGQRAMFEAYARNRYTSTGVIQWMLNNAWPSMIWHLYDYYLRPGGGYFGTKKACEPVHVQYSYDDRSVVVVNTTPRALRQLRVTARLLDAEMGEKFARTVAVDVPADENARALVIPTSDDLTTAYFLKLTLADEAGRELSSNFYWLSTKDDALDWQKSTWYYTPTTSYADFTALNRLPAVELSAAARLARRGAEEVASVRLENPSRTLAFLVRLKINRGRGGEEVLPVLWKDNYFALLPGERREVTATYRVRDLKGASPVLAVEGWNVPAREHALAADSPRR